MQNFGPYGEKKKLSKLSKDKHRTAKWLAQGVFALTHLKELDTFFSSFFIQT